MIPIFKENAMCCEKEIIYSGLASLAKPQDSIRSEVTEYTWQRAAYQSERFSGTMLWAYGNTKVTPLRFDVDLKGWHAVYIGMSYSYSDLTAPLFSPFIVK